MLFFTEFFNQKEFKRNVKERNWLDQYFYLILFDFVFTPTEEPFKRPRNFSFLTFREISKEIQIWPAQPLSLFWKKKPSHSIKFMMYDKSSNVITSTLFSFHIFKQK